MKNYKQPQHCKGCLSFHNAGHKDVLKHPEKQKYNAWCCSIGQPAANVVGHCKIHNMKEEKQNA